MLDVDEAKISTTSLQKSHSFMQPCVSECLLSNYPPFATSLGSAGQQLCACLCWTETSGIQRTGNGLVHCAGTIHCLDRGVSKVTNQVFWLYEFRAISM